MSLGWSPISRGHSHSSVEERATPDKQQVGVSQVTTPSRPEPPPLALQVTSPDTTKTPPHGVPLALNVLSVRGAAQAD